MMGYEHISIPVSFIDNYLTAGGDCVKVYLYLLRALSGPIEDLSFNVMSEKIDMTLNNIKRALKYWENEKLLEVEYTVSGKKTEIKSISILPIPVPNKETEEVAEEVQGAVQEKADIAASYISDDEKEPPITDCERLACRKILEEIIGPLSPKIITELDDFILDKLEYSYEMFEQLIEFCGTIKNNPLSKAKINYNYINTVAIDWHDKGLNNTKKIKKYLSNAKKKSTYTVVKEYLGIDTLAKQEKELIDSWIYVLSYEDEIIKHACIVAKNQRLGISRVDTLLNIWNSKNLRTIDAIEADSESHWQGIKDEINKASGSKKSTANTQFNNFEQRSTDYSIKKIDYSL